LSKAKIGIRFSSVSAETGFVRAHLETDSLPAELGLREGEVYVALALDHAETQVSRGENSGRKLTYTSVLRTLQRVGTIRSGEMKQDEMKHDDMKQDQMKQDDMKKDDMKKDEMKKDEMKKDKKSKKSKKAKKDEMKHDEMKHDDMSKDEMKKN